VKDRLFVIPYSRFHNGILEFEDRQDFYHVSVQEFWKVERTYRFKWIRCGGIARAEAAANVLGIKLLLESDTPDEYLLRARGINSDYNGKLIGGYGNPAKGMTLRESYKIVVDGIRILGETERG